MKSQGFEIWGLFLSFGNTTSLGNAIRNRAQWRKYNFCGFRERERGALGESREVASVEGNEVRRLMLTRPLIVSLQAQVVLETKFNFLLSAFFEFWESWGPLLWSIYLSLCPNCEGPATKHGLLPTSLGWERNCSNLTSFYWGKTW